MVNYCCVAGCGRNNKTSKHLFFYGVPKDSPRLEQWLRAIGREDLLEKNLKKLSYRVCSRHFAPSSIKNKHLCPDAVPMLCLPTSDDFEEEQPQKHSVHNQVICNSCKKPILGFRYKCITCPDYDLCSKCEMFEAHSEHYLLRIPKPVNFKVADDLIKKWQGLVDIEHVTVDSHRSNCSSDDEDDVPIKEYVKQSHNDSGIDLPEEVKADIRNEVSRILQIKHPEPKTLKRKKELKKNSNKKQKTVDREDKCCGTEELEALDVPEMAFADVNDIKAVPMLDIKHEIPSSNFTSTLEDAEQPMTHLNLSDADFILTIS